MARRIELRRVCYKRAAGHEPSFRRCTPKSHVPSPPRRNPARGLSQAPWHERQRPDPGVKGARLAHQRHRARAARHYCRHRHAAGALLRRRRAELDEPPTRSRWPNRHWRRRSRKRCSSSRLDSSSQLFRKKRRCERLGPKPTVVKLAPSDRYRPKAVIQVSHPHPRMHYYPLSNCTDLITGHAIRIWIYPTISSQKYKTLFVRHQCSLSGLDSPAAMAFLEWGLWQSIWRIPLTSC